MKILHVVRDLDPRSGGLTTAVLGMAMAQADLGHEVKVAATDYGLDQPPEIRGVQCFLYPSDFNPWRWSNRMAGSLPSLIQETAIVHIHGVWDYQGLLAARLCHKMKVPYILTSHGMLHKTSLAKHLFRKKIYLLLFGNFIMKKAHAIHFTSKLERRNSKIFGLRRKSFIAPLGISLSDYRSLPDRLAFREKFLELKGHRFVLFLGRLHPKKRPEMLIKAFHRLVSRNEDVFLVLAGNGPVGYIRRLKKLISRLKLTERVLFTGMLQGQDVLKAYRAAEVFVLPSLQENFGLSIVEAMACGCPVIISDLLDLAYDIRSANAGLLHGQSSESLTVSIEKLLNDPALCKRMGENARNLVAKKFTWNKTAQSLIEVYENVVAGTKIKGPTLCV